jgi:hypothetical protein
LFPARHEHRHMGAIKHIPHRCIIGTLSEAIMVLALVCT